MNNNSWLSFLRKKELSKILENEETKQIFNEKKRVYIIRKNKENINPNKTKKELKQLGYFKEKRGIYTNKTGFEIKYFYTKKYEKITIEYDL